MEEGGRSRLETISSRGLDEKSMSDEREGILALLGYRVEIVERI
tara:strand:+ start:44 stop:175 length:132 start_codon:yes stop_codon:yes gene_type:complete